MTPAVAWLSFVHIRKSSALPGFHSVIRSARELRVVIMMSKVCLEGNFRVLDMMHCLRGQFGSTSLRKVNVLFSAIPIRLMKVIPTWLTSLERDSVLLFRGWVARGLPRI
jgi:hypothetical protein